MRSLPFPMRPLAAIGALATIGAAQAQTIDGYVDLNSRNILKSEDDVFFSHTWAKANQTIDFDATKGIFYGPTQTDPYLFAASRAVVKSTYGSIKASLRSTSRSDKGDAFAALSVRHEDTFTIDKPGLTGTMGTFDAKIRVDGLFQALRGGPEGGVTADWSVNYRLSYDDGGATEGDAGAGGLDLSGNREWTKNYNGYSGDTFGIYTVPVSFVYGTPIDLSLEFGLSTRAYLTEGFMEADLGHTVEWEGITNLRDASGSAVADYISSSKSGFGYGEVAAVPEPASMAALGAGLLAVLRRRRKV